MKPILHYDPRSPPVRSVLMLLKMLDIDVQLNLIDLFKAENLKSDFKNVNPSHTVPTLVDGENDLILTDSHVILMHLCEKYGKIDVNLWPQEYKDRLKVINMLFFEAGVIFRRDSELMSDIIRNKFKNVEISHHQRNIHEIYGICEVFLNKHKYLATDNLTIADISAVTTLSTVDLMFPITVAQWPKLASWLALMQSLPEYEVNKTGLQELKDIMEEIGEFKFPTKEIQLRCSKK